MTRFETIRLHWPLLGLLNSCMDGVSSGADGSETENLNRRSKLAKETFTSSIAYLLPVTNSWKPLYKYKGADPLFK
jgi:hypothetical protein